MNETFSLVLSQVLTILYAVKYRIPIELVSLEYEMQMHL